MACLTRALKNANYLQKVAPFIEPESSPPEDLKALPPELLEVLHTPQAQVNLEVYPRLPALLQKGPFPPVAIRAITTGDKDLLRMGEYRGIRMMRVGDYLSRSR
jgi:hypothetical protein